MAACWSCRGRTSMWRGAAMGRPPIRWPRSIASAAPQSRCARTGTDRPVLKLGFVRGDRFHQRHQLALHRLILDLAVGAQQSQAKRAVKKQQALDLPRLAVAVIEEGDGDIERCGDLLKTGGTDAVDALLIFLNLLEADAELIAKLRLGDFLLDAPQPNPLPQFNVGFAGTALLHFLCC